MRPEATLKQKLEDWTKLKLKADKINAEADGQLADLIATFEKKAEPINADRDRKLGTTLVDMQKLEDEIREEMLSHVKAGNAGIPKIETARALAQVSIDRKREIEPATFLRTVPPSRRQDPAFFGCLSVLIGRAEKFLDAPTLARIIRSKSSPSVAITLKSE